MSSAYHPQTDGQTKIVNKCLETYLHCFASTQSIHWVKWMPLAEWWYNTSYHTSIKMTLYESMYVQPPPIVTSYIPRSTNVQEVDTTLSDQEEIICIL